MTIKEIQQIIKDFESSTLTTLELELKDTKIKLSKLKEPEIIHKNLEPKIRTKDQPQVENIDPAIEDHLTKIHSPLVGTFYHASSPEAKPYVKLGDIVKKGQVVCIIEAMKIMNEITAPVDGVIEAILVNNKEVVGYDQVLMTIGEAVEK